MGQVDFGKGVGRFIAVAGLLATAAGTAVAQSGVTVTGVTSAHRNDNSKLVDISTAIPARRDRSTD